MDATVKTRVAFFGTGAIGVPALEALVAEPSVELVAVVTQPDRPAGRNLRPRPSPIKVAAEVVGIPIFQPRTLRDPEALTTLQQWQADLFVVAAYGQILPRPVLDLPRLGCVNIHASLLPRHRGASPIQAAILEGDVESGITLMAMDEGLDTGDILLQARCPILPTDTAGSLHDRLAGLAPDPLLALIHDLERDSQTRSPQDNAQATYAPKIAKSDGCLDWEQPAVSLERQVRAFSPWPGAHTFLPNGALLKIHEAAVVGGSGPPGEILSSPGGTLHIATGQEALALRRVQIAGGRAMPVDAFLQGHPLAPGLKFLLPKWKNRNSLSLLPATPYAIITSFSAHQQSW